jgi:hypothetical protein
MIHSTENLVKSEVKPWEFDGFEYENGAFNYDIAKPYRLWYEYLRLSPTYLLAHRHKTSYKGGLTEAQKNTLPDDFDEVLKTYDEFGDIYEYPFREWWAYKSKKLFGIRSSKLHARVLAYVAEDHAPDKDACLAAVSDMLKYSVFGDDGYAGYMLLKVPLADTRTEIIKNVNEIIDDEVIQTSKRSINPPYKLHGERFHYDALETGLHLLCLRMQNPKTVLWKLGVDAAVSEKYADLDNTVEKLKANMIEPVRVLENLTSRTFKGSTLVMENAARGKFPCKDNVVIPKLNYRYMWQIMRRQHEANERYLNKIMHDIKEGRHPSPSSYTDWEYNIPELKLKQELQELESKKSFLEKQLALHKPGSRFVFGK